MSRFAACTALALIWSAAVWAQVSAQPSTESTEGDAVFFADETSPAELIPIDSSPIEDPPEAVQQPRVDTEGLGPVTLFRLGNENYEAEKFEEAIEYYSAIVDEGIVNRSLFFNLGNAYFRVADFGRAILYYEKARRLAPRDPDIAHNLAYARTFLIDKEMGADQLPGSLETLLILHRWTNTRETLWLLAALSGLLGALVLLKQARRAWSDKVLFGYLRGAVWVLFVLQIGSAGFKLWAEENFRHGVILKDSVRAAAAPGAEEELLELNSGTRVQIEAVRNGFAQIRLPNGVPAFIREDQIGII